MKTTTNVHRNVLEHLKASPLKKSQAFQSKNRSTVKGIESFGSNGHENWPNIMEDLRLTLLLYYTWNDI